MRLQHLLELPASEFLRRDLALLLERQVGTASPKLREAIAVDLRRAQARLDLGNERDRIAATRPDGCFCLGLGGRHPSFIIVPAGDGEEERTVSTWVEYCDCPDGQGARAVHSALRLRRLARQTAARVAKVFAQPSLRNYQDANLRTLTLLMPENRVSFEHALDWATARHEEADGSLLLFGPVGTGKTYLAVALLRFRVEQGQTALFVTVADYLQRIRDTFDAESGSSTSDVLQAARTVDLLVLDDLGARTRLTEWEEGQLYDLLNARLNATLPMLITTNLDPDALRDYLGQRSHSRLLGMCRGNVLPWTGPDRRLA